MENREEHLVKRVCRECNLTRKELAEELDIPLGTIGRWVSENHMPKTATMALNLMLENKKLKDKLQLFKLFKEALKEI